MPRPFPGGPPTSEKGDLLWPHCPGPGTVAVTWRELSLPGRALPLTHKSRSPSGAGHRASFTDSCYRLAGGWFPHHGWRDSSQRARTSPLTQRVYVTVLYL